MPLLDQILGLLNKIDDSYNEKIISTITIYGDSGGYLEIPSRESWGKERVFFDNLEEAVEILTKVIK